MRFQALSKNPNTPFQEPQSLLIAFVNLTTIPVRRTTSTGNITNKVQTLCAIFLTNQQKHTIL